MFSRKLQRPTSPDNTLAGSDEAFAGSDAAFAGADVAFVKSDEAFAKSDEAFAGSDAAFAGSDVAFAKSDAAFADSDEAFAGSDTPFAKSDAAFAKSDEAFAKSDAAFAGSDETFAGSRPVNCLAYAPTTSENATVSALQILLDRYREASLTNREHGTYFEELTLRYLTNEPAYRDLYREVLSYADWAERRGIDKRDAGIDLVAETRSGEVHAIQCKLYAADYRVQKADIDSFFTASGKKPFSHRIIVATTSLWSDHAEEALRDQQIPVTKIDLEALEESVIDWARYSPKKAPAMKAKKALRPHQESALLQRPRATPRRLLSQGLIRFLANGPVYRDLRAERRSKRSTKWRLRSNIRCNVQRKKASFTNHDDEPPSGSTEDSRWCGQR